MSPKNCKRRACRSGGAEPEARHACFAGLWLPLLATVWWITAPAAQAAELSAEAAQHIRSFKPEPVQVGWQAWTGLAAATAPLVIATFEFTKRIVRP